MIIQIKCLIINVLLLIAVGIPATAQRLSDRYFGISKQDFVDTIKIKMWDGAIVVPVEIEGGNQEPDVRHGCRDRVLDRKRRAVDEADGRKHHHS